MPRSSSGTTPAGDGSRQERGIGGGVSIGLGAVLLERGLDAAEGVLGGEEHVEPLLDLVHAPGGPAGLHELDERGEAGVRLRASGGLASERASEGGRDTAGGAAAAHLLEVVREQALDHLLGRLVVERG